VNVTALSLDAIERSADHWDGRVPLVLEHEPHVTLAYLGRTSGISIWLYPPQFRSLQESRADQGFSWCAPRSKLLGDVKPNNLSVAQTEHGCQRPIAAPQIQHSNCTRWNESLHRVDSLGTPIDEFAATFRVMRCVQPRKNL
jgi:hypothetical protein